MTKTAVKALDALNEAHKIALAPFLFQSVVCLRNLGVFDEIFKHRKKGGAKMAEIAETLSLSEYGLGVLLEMAESSDIVEKNELGHFELTKTGYFLAYHPTVNVNVNFTQDVCYKGLFHLEDAIKNGQPEGLKELGSWPTIYEGLSKLPSDVQKSWFEFDHHYSDDIFRLALQQVLKNKPRKIFDIGANTGKFSIACCEEDEQVEVTMIDLPGQLEMALKNAQEKGFEERITGYEIDWLKDNPKIPTGADTIWLCQFLDCFSKEEILKILSTCVASMDDHTQLVIVETYTDRQRFDSSRYVLEATSLYFTVMANGNSKMYKSTDILELAEQAGLEIYKDLPLGEYHTMYICKKSS
ncbi:methyltransferase [Mangrovimonas futianensis]|uniref:methyltransferase n=1 Tax=Mangrovimonas futianensis TaxID=2895523 RepID=UPI001E4A7D8D|nr:methyltransferase [Mangrovimonas futianensis]MCF1421065.1 methyltransferase domain-containing protein [Mangrovimonas futianensis]